MELREKIVRAIERAYAAETGRGVGPQCVAANAILTIPEIAEALEIKRATRKLDANGPFAGL